MTPRCRILYRIRAKIVLEIAIREMNWKRFVTPEMRYIKKILLMFNRFYLFDDNVDCNVYKEPT